MCLSQPDPAWKGHNGRLTGGFISQHVIDLASAKFFLCGPKGFMDNARQILSTLGVNQDRIPQEGFGEIRPLDVEDGLTVERRNAGYVLPCVSRAEGTVVLSVLRSKSQLLENVSLQGDCLKMSLQVLLSGM